MNLHGRKQSVITSCGHVFHKSCLDATKSREIESKCPMCRSLYREKVSKSGRLQARKVAAAKIQSCVRSFLTRRRIVRDHPQIRLRFLSKEKISTRLSDYSRHAVGDANKVVNESEFLINQSDIGIAAKRTDHPLRSVKSDLTREKALQHVRDIFSKITLDQSTMSNQYESAKIRAKRCSECPVCLAPFGKKSVSFLSCSHAIHEHCRIQLDRFMDSPSCPLCRQNYTFVNSVIQN